MVGSVSDTADHWWAVSMTLPPSGFFKYLHHFVSGVIDAHH
jgi:hypothetical protein